MKRDKLKLLIKSLKSGKYIQATKRLRRGDAFCCLGVICDLHRKITKKKGNKWIASPLPMEPECYKYKDTSCRLPEKVKEWCGIDESIEDHLVQINDIQDSPDGKYQHVLKYLKTLKGKK